MTEMQEALRGAAPGTRGEQNLWVPSHGARRSQSAIRTERRRERRGGGNTSTSAHFRATACTQRGVRCVGGIRTQTAQILPLRVCDSFPGGRPGLRPTQGLIEADKEPGPTPRLQTAAWIRARAESSAIPPSVAYRYQNKLRGPRALPASIAYRY